MLEIALTIFILLFIISTVDFMWQKEHVKGEHARKASHILTGVFVATWPLFLNWQQMRIIWVIGVTFVIASRSMRLMKSFYDVDRHSYGEVFGPLTLGLLTFFGQHPWVFVVSVLYVALSDGFAAVVGKRYGKRNEYKVWGTTKSLAGTAAFLVTSILIMAGAAIFAPITADAAMIAGLLGVAILATVIENCTPYGFDNVTVPLFVYGSLSLLT